MYLTHIYFGYVNKIYLVKEYISKYNIFFKFVLKFI